MKFKSRHSSKLLCGAALAAMLIASPSIAQEADGEDEDNVRRLGEITVSATRRDASIQDVPIAVSAFDPETLEAQGVRDITSLSSVSSSFNLQSSQTESGGTSIRIRGVGTTGNNIGLESSVAVFIDGVFLSRPGVALGDLLDLEQLEVLRGPQGTLFGRNTSAGALNITTAKPNLEEFEGFANISYGNRDFLNVQGGVSVPIVKDVLAARVSGAFRQRDGFLTNPTLGIESNNRDRYTLRGQLLFEPTDAISIRLIGDYADTSEQCCDAVIIQDLIQTNEVAPGINLFDTVPGVVPSTGLPDSTGGVPIFGFDALDDRETNAEQFENPTEQWGISGQLNWDLGLAKLTYIGAFRNFQSQSVQESDFTGLNVFSVAGSAASNATLNGGLGTGFIDTTFFTDGETAAEIAALPTQSEIETQTHELRLQGVAFDDRLDWLLGAYYSDEQIVSNGSLTLGSDVDFLTAALFGGTVGPAPLELLAGGITPVGSFAFNEFRQDGESYSIFTHNSFAVTDRLTATVGLRYVDETKDGTFEQFAGQSDACAGLSNGVLTGAVAGAAVPAALGIGCFPFATVANLPTSAFLPTPQTFSDDPNEAGVFVEDFEDDELVWTLKGAYSFTENLNGYVSFTHGFKSGGFNLDSSAASGGVDPRFDSEEVDSFEIGLKGDFFDGRVRANAAFFNQKIDNFQVLEFTGVQFTTFNVDEAISTGVELEVQAQLLDQLTLTSAITYADARFPNDCAQPDPDTGAAPIANASALCGQDLTNAPEFVGIWGGTWQDDFLAFNQDLTYFGNVNVRYETDRRTSTQALVVGTDTLNPLDIQEANTKINLRAGIGSADGQWQLEGFVTNVTDKQTRGITFNIPLRQGSNSRGAFIDAPRTYGATLRTKF
ncbi:MAG: TonB-dependent receptor [Hyphomonadaceae bacterium]